MKNKFLTKTLLVLLIGLIFSTSFAVGAADVPNLKVGYVFTNHQTPLMVAAKKGKAVEADGVYLKEIVSRKKYALIKKDRTLANLELIESTSGSQTMTMMAQGHLDLGFASSAANITAIDKGINIKMLCPVHTEGIGLVIAKNSSVNNWDEFKALLENSQEPIKVGYHSPTSAPLILFEAAIKENGISYTSNPHQQDADILLVDLKGTKNLIPALNSKQVDAWVGPSPYPSLAVTENIGKIALQMKNLPPKGKWYDFPCCVLSADDKVIKSNEEVVQSLVSVINSAANYSDKNKAEAAKITAKWTGVPEEAAQMSSIKYTAKVNKTWTDNVGLVYNSLQSSNRLNGSFETKSYSEIKEILYDFTFINNVTKTN